MSSEEKFSPQPIPIEQFDESIDDDNYDSSPKLVIEESCVVVVGEPEVPAECNPEAEAVNMADASVGVAVSVSPEPMDSQMNEDEMTILHHKDMEISELKRQLSQLMSEFPPEIRDIDLLTSSHVLELCEPISSKPGSESPERPQRDSSEQMNLNFAEKLLVNDLPTGMPWDAWPLVPYLDKNMTPLNESSSSSLGTSERKSSKKLPLSDMCIFGKRPLEMPLDLCTCARCGSLVTVINYPSHYGKNQEHAKAYTYLKDSYL